MLQWALIVATKHGQARPIDGHGFPRSKATRTSFNCSTSTCSITTAYGKWPAIATTAVAKPTATINTFHNGTSIHSSVSTHLQHQQQNLQPQGMPLATGQAFPPSQRQHQLRMNSFLGTTSAAKSTARGNVSGNWTSFTPSQFSNQRQHQLRRPQPQAMPLATNAFSHHGNSGITVTLFIPWRTIEI